MVIVFALVISYIMVTMFDRIMEHFSGVGDEEYLLL